MLPEDTPEYVTRTLRKVFADDEVKVSIVGAFSRGPASPMRDDLMTAVSSLTGNLWPGVQAVPISSRVHGYQ
jgi:hypothetical protein